MTENFEKNLNGILLKICAAMFTLLIGLVIFTYTSLAGRVQALEEKGPDVIVAKKDIETIKESLGKIESRIDLIAASLNIK